MAIRGEYKMPGGKLVAVEFEVRDGSLREVVVTGDFFLYPEEALPLLARALENAPVSRDPGEFTRRLERVLTQDVELVGASPEGIAIAILRGLETGIVERERAE